MTRYPEGSLGCSDTATSGIAISRLWLPAVMINGVFALNDATSDPIALPVPAAVCRLTRAGLPWAWANPSAIASTAASCRPST